MVSIAAISGDHGHAFVYAQVRDAIGSHPAPPGSSPTSYYSRWQAVPIYAPGCPWVWAVFVYDRATNRQLNAPPPGSPAPNFQTTTVFCPSPTVTPVNGPRLAIAQARLDLDLTTTITPRHPTAGSHAAITAELRGTAHDDLGLLLSMAIDDWRVDRWRLEFGDGQAIGVPGGSDRIAVSHVYRAAIVYEARVVASISGTAQAAEYGPSGAPFLIRRPFTVAVGNDLPVLVSDAPATRYLAPIVEIAVGPTIAGRDAPPETVRLRRIEVPRGALVNVYLRPMIVREGYRTVGGRFAGWAQSMILRWRYAGSPGRPPDRVQPDTQWLTPDTPLQLRWDSPDMLIGHGSADYVVDLRLEMRALYPDGEVLDFALPAAFGVTVQYTALNE